jgi:ribosomal-protein-alanine N-acetyltransferase
MQLADVAQVSDMEREAFPPPWPATNFRRDLTVNTSTHYVVACAPSLDDKARTVQSTGPSVEDRRPGSFLHGLRNAAARFLGGDSLPQPTTDIILGFAGVWFLADEAHLATIAVRSDLRLRGIGERLLGGIFDLALEHNAKLVTLEVRASNQAAQGLYEKYGFVVVGRRPGYYSDNKEDAILMTADGIASPLFQDNLERLRPPDAIASAPPSVI